MFSARQCSVGIQDILKMVTHALGDWGWRTEGDPPSAESQHHSGAREQKGNVNHGTWGRRNGKLQDRIGNRSSVNAKGKAGK
jgi:hypothetical protein